MAPKNSFYFESENGGAPLYLETPVHRICARKDSEVLDALDEIDRWTAKQKYYLAGYIGYEAGYAIMDIPYQRISSSPLVDFYVYERPSKYTRSSDSPTAFHGFTAPEKYTRYEKSFKSIEDNLRQGNTYQVNYTYRARCKTIGNTDDVFRKLLVSQPSKYAVMAELEEQDILSVSPELFFSKRGTRIVSKPMKGTLPIGETHVSDKIRAENMMIVDLIRNDLAKVAKPESIRVTKLMDAEQYPTLQQIVSTIEGEAHADTGFGAIIRALFPCGSITGAPKRRTMELIRDLEESARGLYTGTIGYITPGNDMQFNVAIRTLWGREEWTYGVGGGVVLESAVKDEYEEAVLKAKFLRQANSHFHLFETMLVENNRIKNFEDHLSRLKQSAETFGFHWNESNVREAIPKSSEPARVRLSLYADGSVKTEIAKTPEPPKNPKIAISPVQGDSRNKLLYYKTSLREFYEASFAMYEAEGYYDVVFTNERKEVTEASRHNVFVRFGSDWFTPPISCGLLPGIERQKRIQEWNATEKILHVGDLVEADEVALTNSLRGSVTVEVIS